MLPGYCTRTLVFLFDVGFGDDELPFLVMEAVEGRLLSQVLEDHGAMPIKHGLSLWTDVCSAISHCHLRGVVHNRLNLHEIIIPDKFYKSGPAGAPAKIIDFGDSLTVGAVERDHPRVSSQPDDRSQGPQQLGPSGDERTDVYAVGVMMLQALTGKPVTELYSAISQKALMSYANSLPKELIKIIEKCVDPEPAKRPRMREVEADLRRVRL